MSGPRPCRACGMTIEIRPGPNGRDIPLQRVRSVYVLNADGTIAKADAIGDAICVSHWETCPSAEQFKKPKTKARA